MNHSWGFIHSLRGTSAALNIGILIALISISLVTCGYSGSHQGNASSVQVVHPPAPVQNCGIVQGLGSLKVPVADSGAKQVENCFWHAYQHCHPATLIYISGGVDPAFTRTFTIHNETGKCSISDAKQQRIVPKPLSVAETYICAGLIEWPNGLNFYACGKDGDIFVQGL